MKTIKRRIREISHTHLFELTLLKVGGECCRPWSKGGKTKLAGNHLAYSMIGMMITFSASRVSRYHIGKTINERAKLSLAPYQFPLSSR